MLDNPPDGQSGVVNYDRLNKAMKINADAAGPGRAPVGRLRPTVEMPLKNVPCQLDNDHWTNWKEFDTGEQIDLNNCLWSLPAGEERERRLKTLMTAQALLRDLLTGKIDVAEVDRRLERGGFSAEELQQWMNVTQQAAAYNPELIDPKISSKMSDGGEWSDESVSSIIPLADTKHVVSGEYVFDEQRARDTEDLLTIFAQEAMRRGMDKVLMPLPKDYNGKDHIRWTTGKGPDDPSWRRNSLLESYFKLFTNVDGRSFDDEPEIKEYLKSIGITDWSGGKYSERSFTKKDVYASMLAYIADQALRNTAKFNSYTGMATNDDDYGNRVYGAKTDVAEVFESAYRAIDKDANEQIGSCAVSAMEDSFATAVAVFDHPTAEEFGLTPGEAATPGERDAVVGPQPQATRQAYVKGVRAPSLATMEECDAPTPPASATRTTTPWPTPTATSSTVTVETSVAETPQTTVTSTENIPTPPPVTVTSSGTPVVETDVTTVRKAAESGPREPDVTRTVSVEPIPDPAGESVIVYGQDNAPLPRTQYVYRGVEVAPATGPIVDTGGHVSRSGVFDRVYTAVEKLTR